LSFFFSFCGLARFVACPMLAARVGACSRPARAMRVPLIGRSRMDRS
jgi:hypothetical protein